MPGVFPMRPLGLNPIVDVSDPISKVAIQPILGIPNRQTEGHVNAAFVTIGIELVSKHRFQVLEAAFIPCIAGDELAHDSRRPVETIVERAVSLRQEQQGATALEYEFLATSDPIDSVVRIHVRETVSARDIQYHIRFHDRVHAWIEHSAKRTRPGGDLHESEILRPLEATSGSKSDEPQ